MQTCTSSQSNREEGLFENIVQLEASMWETIDKSPNGFGTDDENFNEDVIS